jgi:hypothetical protein
MNYYAIIKDNQIQSIGIDLDSLKALYHNDINLQIESISKQRFYSLFLNSKADRSFDMSPCLSCGQALSYTTEVCCSTANAECGCNGAPVEPQLCDNCFDKVINNIN